MTAEDFREIALSLPEAVEASHMAHPDFRVRGKIFATLGYPDDQHGVILLPVDEQAMLTRAQPIVFSAVTNAWGRRGATQVLLESVDAETLRQAMTAAWRRVAPKRLARERSPE